MTIWRLYYHVIFVTEGRQPWLRVEVRLRLLGALRQKAEELGCLLHAAFAMPEHVHLAISIPPAHSIARVVGQLKGASSHLLAQELLEGQPFAWRRGYGVFSFGERSLPDIRRYIEQQEQHHASRRLWDALERTDELETPSSPPAEQAHP